MNRRIPILILCVFLGYPFLQAQTAPDYTGGIKIPLNEKGDKLIRFITWSQVWATYDFDAPEDVSPVNFNLRRSRVLLYAQINKRTLILSHFGLNNLTGANMTPVGTGDRSSLFLHDAWIEYKVADKHTVGAGLHYFNGVSRLNNQSTLNMMTLDNNRASWSTLGLTDQFARQLGIFGKGAFGKLQYQVAINDAMLNSLDQRNISGTTFTYRGREVLGSEQAGKTFAGYFSYNLWDQESNFLPYKVGTYLGQKKILNIGGGFFLPSEWCGTSCIRSRCWPFCDRCIL